MKNKELTFKTKKGSSSSGTISLVRRNLTLCFDGVRHAFPGIPDDVKTVTFVFSTRPSPEAVKLSFSVSQDDYDWLITDPCNRDNALDLDDGDYILHFDDEDCYLMHYADRKMRKLWESGYNYMRAEYVV